jgi:hypothetical protein
MKLTEHGVRFRNGDRLSISNPDDFVLDGGRPADSSRIFDPDVSPYCFDLSNSSLVCVSTPDISREVFFYQAQRQYARSVIRAPFDVLPRGPSSPILLFSIGRCGSTLLVRALQAAGVRAVSEPDFFRQVAYYHSSGVSLQRLLAPATGLLPYSVIKLHLECNNAPITIAGGFAAPKIMFVLRDPVEWAASLRRVSRNALQPDWAAALLKTGLNALDQLTRSYSVRISYYEDFRKLTAEYLADLVSWTGGSARITHEQLLRVAANDAQEGTFVSRASLRDVAEDPAFRTAFAHAWKRSRPAELISRLRLRFL